MNTITVYTKPNCPLCDEAMVVIESVRTRHAFELVFKDILESYDDYEHYKHDIPVILLNGVELARHRLNEDQLVAALRGTTPSALRRL